MQRHDIKIIARNKKAKHDYFIEETYEAGIELKGTEVKSIREGKVNLRDSYAYVRNGEVFISNMHISPFKQGNIYNVDPLRERKLLLHKNEIKKLLGYTTKQGYTLVPLSLYLKRNLVKVELAIAKGKKVYDKREAIKRKTFEREMQRALKEKGRIL